MTDLIVKIVGSIIVVGGMFWAILYENRRK